MTNPVWTDQRVVRGMRRQLDAKRRALDGGARRLGWKLGLGDARARQQLKTSGPLVAFLTDAGKVSEGAPVSTYGWGTPLLECEVALHLSRTISADGSDADAISSIGG